MRRSDKEITDRAVIEEILQKAVYGHFALVDEGYPYCLPMNFVYREGKIYLHSASEGRKIAILRREERIGFSVESDVAVLRREKACYATMRYRSVIGSGTTRFITKTEEKMDILRYFAGKYAEMPQASFSEGMVENVCVIEVSITELSGKKNQI